MKFFEPYKSTRPKFGVYSKNGSFGYGTDDYKEAKLLAMMLSERTNEEIIIMEDLGPMLSPHVLERYKGGKIKVTED